MSEENDEEMDDDDIMECIASGKLPATTETVLALNQAYQELLQELIRRVDSSLVQNREKQRNIQTELDNCTEGSGKQYFKVPALQYMPPYFRDTSGLAPPLNQEAQQKKKRFELDALVEPARKWTKVEQERLTTGVIASLKQELVLPLTNRRDLLNDKISEAADPEIISSLKAAAEDLDNKIETAINAFKIESLPEQLFDSIDWNTVSATHLQGTRTPIECQLAWRNQHDPRLEQNSCWNIEEKQSLQALAERYEWRNWDDISKELGTGRTAFQCFEKYQRDLNTSMLKRTWTEMDDTQLSEIVDSCRMGSYVPWQQVASLIEGRTATQCQGRWERRLNPNTKHGRWQEDEDLLLIAAVEKHGAKDWPKIAEFVPGRIASQCRERWSTALASNIRMGCFSKEEDEMLLATVLQFGAGEWAKISKFLPGRTSNACKTRYRTMAKKLRENQEVTYDSLTLPPNEVKRVEKRIGKQILRKQRVREMYTQLGGTISAVNDATVNPDAILLDIPEHLRLLFLDKWKAIKSHNSTWLASPASQIITDDDDNRAGARKRNRTCAKRPVEVAVTTDEPQPTTSTSGTNSVEENICRALWVSRYRQKSNLENNFDPSSMRALSDMVFDSTTPILPNTATVEIFRRLLAGKQRYMTQTSVLRSYSNAINLQNDSLMQPSPMRSYIDDRNAPYKPAAAVNAETTHSTLTGLLLQSTTTPDAAKEYHELQKTFTKLFFWPAFLCVMNEDSSDS